MELGSASAMPSSGLLGISPTLKVRLDPADALAWTVRSFLRTKLHSRAYCSTTGSECGRCEFEAIVACVKDVLKLNGVVLLLRLK